MNTDTTQTPLTDSAQNRVGDLPFDAKLVGKEDMAALELQLAAANARIAELESERENWRVSSVCRELAAERDAANTQVLALRKAIAPIAEQYNGYISWWAFDAVKKALSAPPPPVVAKEEFDRLKRERDEAVKESSRTSQKWMSGIEECCRVKIKFDAVTDHSPTPTLDQFIRGIKDERDAAEKDAEDLAKSMDAVVRATRLQEPLHLPDGFPMRNWLPGEWPLMKDARAMVKALAAHEARKTSNQKL